MACALSKKWPTKRQLNKAKPFVVGNKFFFNKIVDCVCVSNDDDTDG